MFELIGNYFHFITNPNLTKEFVLPSSLLFIVLGFILFNSVVAICQYYDKNKHYFDYKDLNILHYLWGGFLGLILLIMLFFFIGPFLYFAVFVGIPVLIVVGIGYGLTKIKPYHIVQFFKQFKIKIEKK